MERHLIFLLAVLAVLLGMGQAIQRPTVFQLGQNQQPPDLGSGVSWRSGQASPRLIGGMAAGRLRSDGGRQRWTRFQGRGPSGAK